MKIKEIIDWPEHWSTPLGTREGNAPGADGILVDLSLSGTSIIVLAVQCQEGKYFSSIRAEANFYDLIVDFLKRNHGRSLREIIDTELDLSEVIH
jgi:hypothetical protein